MEKIVKEYVKPNIKVNDFVSRHHVLGWELANGTTDQQLGKGNNTFDEEEEYDYDVNVWER
jgi:hypothetical protein